MTDYMVEGLIKRRAQIAGDLAHTQAAMSALARDLEAIDAALRIVAPDLVIESVLPKLFRPPADWSKRGEMQRTLLAILRMAPHAMTSREIAAQMIAERGVPSDTGMLNRMSKRCKVCLRGMRERGHVKSTEGPTGFWLLWEIVR